MFFEGSFQPTPKVLLILIVRSVNYIPKVTESEMQSENEIMIKISNCPRPQIFYFQTVFVNGYL